MLELAEAPLNSSSSPISFEDGLSYEHSMGDWSRAVGEKFLPWLNVPTGQHWVDIGCGTGCLTDLLVRSCSPSSVWGIDTSNEQIVFARDRFGAASVRFQTGNALDLPYSDNSFDVATMGLALYFIPDTERALGEMKRIVRPGGIVASYGWDILGGGSPFEPVYDELKKMGARYPLPPSVEISKLEALSRIWHESELLDVETNSIEVERTFENFDEIWKTFMVSSIGRAIYKLDNSSRIVLREKLHQQFKVSRMDGVSYKATANSVKGYVPN